VNIGGHTGPVRVLAFTPDSKRLCSAGMAKVVRIWRLPEGGTEGIPEGAKAAFIEEVWRKEQTLRWEVARGLR